jgi:transcriptional regulator GlxA family with amidase domain
MTAKPLAIGALLYPGFEMLDMFGPLEMFSILGTDRVRIHMIAKEAGPVHACINEAATAGPRIMADHDLQDAPPLDLLLIPGGVGTLSALEDEALLEFLRRRAAEARVVASVCTGSALLARAGLLDGHRATSNKQFFALASMQSAQVDWIEQARWVEDGKFFTSSGVSAGMDMSLAIIEQLFGAEAAEAVEKGAEYTRHRDADQDPFAAELNVLAKQLGLV